MIYEIQVRGRREPLRCFEITDYRRYSHRGNGWFTLTLDWCSADRETLLARARHFNNHSYQVRVAERDGAVIEWIAR